MREFIIDKTQKPMNVIHLQNSHCFLNMKELTPEGSPINMPRAF